MLFAHFPVGVPSGRVMNGRMKMVRKTIAVALLAGSLVLTACNTVSGAGKDLQSASQDVKEEINK